MAINKVNLYTPGQNLTNLANNVDYNRLGIDQTNIEVDFSGSPAQVTIKQGSLIEINGNRYIVQGADYVFTMAGATDNYITFNETTPSFSSTTIKGTYDDAKAGVYQADNETRTICWYVDQIEEIFNRDMSLMYPNIGDLTTEMNGYKIDNDPASALLLFSMSKAATSSGTETLDITVKKPITIGMKVNVTGVASGFANAEIYGIFDSVIETLPIRAANSVSPSPSTVRAVASLTPGEWQLSGTWSLTGGTATLDWYMIGVYGQTNFDAVSVYV